LGPIGVRRLGRLINPGSGSYRTLRDGSLVTRFQALKCLATIIQSLRDDSSSGIPWTLRAKFLPTSEMP